MYIYIYIHRDRDIEKDRERERCRSCVVSSMETRALPRSLTHQAWPRGADNNNDNSNDNGFGYINTHLDVACVLKVRTPLPQFQSSCKDTPAAANKNECLFIRPVALTCTMSVNIDIRGKG